MRESDSDYDEESKRRTSEINGTSDKKSSSKLTTGNGEGKNPDVFKIVIAASHSMDRNNLELMRPLPENETAGNSSKFQYSYAQNLDNGGLVIDSMLLKSSEN